MKYEDCYMTFSEALDQYMDATARIKHFGPGHNRTQAEEDLRVAKEHMDALTSRPETDVKVEPEPITNLPEQVHLDQNVADALLYVLWQHQGFNSTIGQPIRKMLGIARDQHLTKGMVARCNEFHRKLTSTTDVGRIDKLLTMSRQSRTGVTILHENVMKQGSLVDTRVRLMTFHKHHPSAQTLREAIDHAELE